jgi:hypothetical protein
MKTQAGWIWQKRVKIEYPLCNAPYFWTKKAQVMDFVIFIIGCLRSWGMPYDLLFPIILLILWILSLEFKPVKISVRGEDYLMKIKNEDDAREFTMLNHLSPIG